MLIRHDKFKVGDIVTWADDHYATLTDGRKKTGDGPFKLTMVIDRPYRQYGDGQSNWSSMGHTQHVWIRNRQYSGAFFKKVEA